MELSIITVNYNNVAGLKRTAESVLSQTFREFEWIIVDGGSTDGSRELIEELTNNPMANISYWRSEKDKGIYNAMNKGVERAIGGYCIFMNSGDCFHDNEVLKDIYEYGMIADIISGDMLFDNGIHCLSQEKVSLAHFYEHSLYHQATFIRTALLKENNFDETLKIAADWKFFLEEIVVNDRTYQHIHRDVAIFECGGFSAGNKELIRKEQLSVLKQYFPVCVLRDYEKFIHGADDYDRFFMTLKHSRLKNIIFNLDKIVVKFALVFKR